MKQINILKKFLNIKYSQISKLTAHFLSRIGLANDLYLIMFFILECNLQRKPR